LNTVTTEMPGPLWTLVIAGAIICIAVSWFFHTASFSIHIWMTTLLSVLLGLIIFLIAVLDNPYRGKLSVTPEPLKHVYEQIMTPSNLVGKLEARSLVWVVALVTLGRTPVTSASRRTAESCLILLL